MRTLSLLIALALLTTALSAQPLSGTYTINRFLPAGPTNFTTLASSVAALVANGVSGPVIFDIYDDDASGIGSSPFGENNAFVSVNVGWAPNNAVLVLAFIATASPVNTITYRAAAGESPIFDAAGRAMGVFWNGANYVTLDGIDIRNALFDGISMYNEAAMNAAGPTGNTIQNCRIHDCASAGIVLYGNVAGPVNTTIRNNFFYHLLTAPSGGFLTNSRFAYIGSRRCQGTVIQHNTFYADTVNGTSGAVIGSNRGTPSTPYASFRNNLIVKSAGPTLPIFRWLDGAQIPPGVPTSMDYNVYDDTSTGTGAGPFMVDVGTTYASLGAFQASTYAPREANGRSGMALLMNPAMGDLHIVNGSAATGAADPATTVMVDIDGQARPGGCASDAGADEVQESGPVAGFTATPLSGPSPLSVTFTDTSFSCVAGGITSWAWDFNGDLVIDSTLQNPTFVYTCPGSFTVSLTVNDAMGTNVATVNNYVNSLNQAFTMTTAGPGPNQYNLVLNAPPTTCPNTSTSVQGYTLVSISTVNPVGTGFFFGLTFDGLTLAGLMQVAFPGNPLHFIVTPGTYPNGGPLVLPPGIMAPLAGLSLDACVVYQDVNSQITYFSNVSRVMF